MSVNSQPFGLCCFVSFYNINKVIRFKRKTQFRIMKKKIVRTQQCSNGKQEQNNCKNSTCTEHSGAALKSRFFSCVVVELIDAIMPFARCRFSCNRHLNIYKNELCLPTFLPSLLSCRFRYCLAVFFFFLLQPYFLIFNFFSFIN